MFEKQYKCPVPTYDFIDILVVGCGGTGSHVASSLARMLYDFRTRNNRTTVDLTLVDHDLVEEGNVGRQLFSHVEIGRNKAVTLAQRLNGWLGLDIAAVPFSVPDAWMVANLDQKVSERMGKGRSAVILVGCVDNPTARKHIAQKMYSLGIFEDTWYIDAGNDYQTGQVLIGNMPNRRKGKVNISGMGLVNNLPAPFVQMPDLLDEDSTNTELPGCTLATVTGEQSLFINQYVSSAVTKLVYDMLYLSELHQMGMWINSGETYQVNSIPITESNLTHCVGTYNEEYCDSEPIELEVIDHEKSTSTSATKNEGETG